MALSAACSERVGLGPDSFSETVFGGFQQPPCACTAAASCRPRQPSGSLKGADDPWTRPKSPTYHPEVHPGPEAAGTAVGESLAPPAHVHTCIPAHRHTCTAAHVHTWTPVQLHTCIPAQLHTCTRAYLHTCTAAHVHTCTPAHVYTCTAAHLHMCIPAHVHTCIVHTCIPAHLHTCTHTCTPFPTSCSALPRSLPWQQIPRLRRVSLRHQVSCSFFRGPAPLRLRLAALSARTFPPGPEPEPRSPGAPEPETQG